MQDTYSLPSASRCTSAPPRLIFSERRLYRRRRSQPRILNIPAHDHLALVSRLRHDIARLNTGAGRLGSKLAWPRRTFSALGLLPAGSRDFLALSSFYVLISIVIGHRDLKVNAIGQNRVEITAKCPFGLE